MARLTYVSAGDRDSHNFTTAEGLPLNVYIDDGIPTPQAGAVVECEIETRTSKAGKQYSKIVSINGQRGTGQRGGGFQRGGGRSAPAYDPRTFVSNVVGQAIAHDKIKTPAEIAAWANEAYKVISGLGPAMAKAEVGQAATTPAAVQGGASAPPVPAPPQAPNDDIPF